MTTLRGNTAIFADNDSCITLVLTDKDGEPETGATASLTIKKDTVPIITELSMAETATLGTYEAVVLSTLALVAGDSVSLQVDAESDIGEIYRSLDPTVDVINKPLN